ncbi:unnamed protein product [Merluccius merluccius]
MATRTKLMVLEETAVRFVFSLKAIARNLCLEPGALEPGALEPWSLEPWSLEWSCFFSVTKGKVDCR